MSSNDNNKNTSEPTPQDEDTNKIDKKEEVIPMPTEEPVKSTAPAAPTKRKLPIGSIVFYGIFGFIALFFIICTIGGFAGTGVKNAAFHFNALRAEEDKTMGTKGYITIDAAKRTMYKKREQRYFDAHQPSAAVKGPTMAGSWDVMNYPDCMPIGNNYQFRAFYSDEMTAFDIMNSKSRFHALHFMNKDVIHSWLVDQNVSKIVPFKNLESSQIEEIKNSPLVAELHRNLMDLLDKIFIDFLNCRNSESYKQLYSIYPDSDGKMQMSDALAKEVTVIIGLIDKTEGLTNTNLANKGKEPVTVDTVLGFFKRQGLASPCLTDSVVMGKIYNWALILLSDVGEKELVAIEAFKKKVDEKEEATKTYNEQNPKASDASRSKALKKFSDSMAYTRTAYIYRAISIAFANLYLEEKDASNFNRYPFNSETDSRNFFAKFFCVGSTREKTAVSNQIIGAIFGKRLRQHVKTAAPVPDKKD